MRTFCPDCSREVGVTRDYFNRCELGSDTPWRTTAHRRIPTDPKTRCTGSRIIVHANTIWSMEAASA